MSRCSPSHLKLDAQGIGKCSVPMWCGGGPSGFCDEPAYGERLPAKFTQRPDGYVTASDGGYTGYVPGLACPRHSGPSTRAFLDGNAWCAVYPDFINLQESPAGFGDTPDAARAALERDK